MCALKYLSRDSVIAAFFGNCSSCTHAEVQLPHVLSDHAVLQHGEPIRIWGWADKEEKVTVTGTKTAQPVVRTDFLVGDIWVASGQSNMAMPLFAPQRVPGLQCTS